MDIEQRMENNELVIAAFDGDMEDIVRLLDTGVDINQDGQCWNPLHAAVENDQLESVRLLIEKGADMEKRADPKKAGIDCPPLDHAVDAACDCAAQSGTPGAEVRTDIITRLLSAGADPKTGLKYAKLYGSARIMDLLSAANEAR